MIIINQELYRNKVLEILSNSGSALVAVKYLKDNHCHDRTLSELLEEVKSIRDNQDGHKSDFDKLKERAETLETALRSLLELGRKDFSNPKYDGYFEQAAEALNKGK